VLLVNLSCSHCRLNKAECLDNGPRKLAMILAAAEDAGLDSGCACDEATQAQFRKNSSSRPSSMYVSRGKRTREGRQWKDLDASATGKRTAGVLEDKELRWWWMRRMVQMKWIRRWKACDRASLGFPEDSVISVLSAVTWLSPSPHPWLTCVWLLVSRRRGLEMFVPQDWAVVLVKAKVKAMVK
jgi:hypothetical protein